MKSIRSPDTGRKTTPDKKRGGQGREAGGMEIMAGLACCATHLMASTPLCYPDGNHESLPSTLPLFLSLLDTQ